MDRDVRIGRTFEAALRAAGSNPQLWVPGIGNGALGSVLRALARLPDGQIIALIRRAVARRPEDGPETGETGLAERIVSDEPGLRVIRVEEETQRIVRLDRAEVEARLKEPGYWLLAIDPETLAVRIVLRNADGFVPDVEGHEDLFPLSMAVEREDGFIEGGDWLIAHTPSKREHDGVYRSYWVEWSVVR